MYKIGIFHLKFRNSKMLNWNLIYTLKILIKYFIQFFENKFLIIFLKYGLTYHLKNLL